MPSRQLRRQQERAETKLRSYEVRAMQLQQHRERIQEAADPEGILARERLGITEQQAHRLVKVADGELRRLAIQASPAATRVQVSRFHRERLEAMRQAAGQEQEAAQQSA